MSGPWMIDAFCGAGGAAKGYQRAGFRVLGFDINPQPNYCGDDFIQGDAVTLLKEHGHKVVFRHASPPCQASSALTKGNRKRGWTDSHVDLIPDTRAALLDIGGPSVIENVQGSSLRRDLTLCGEMFGLEVIRHRYFEVDGFDVIQPAHVPHRGRVAGLRHGEWFTGPYFAVYGDGGGKGTVAEWQRAMDMPWTDVRKEIAEAIPPAYTQLIGEQLAEHLTAVAA